MEQGAGVTGMDVSERGFTLRNVSVCQGDRVILSDISCRITPGTAWGILGRSGSGKSTLLRLLAGLEVPGQGEIFLDGKPVSRGGKIVVRPARRNIAMVFQDLALWPNLTVLENVTLGRNGADTEARALRCLEQCGILHLASRYPCSISGGEQQRLALARAIAENPSYLFLDEPFNGLDLEIKQEITGYIARLAAENSITVLLVSHDPFEILRMCSNALVLERGMIAGHGSLAALLENPESGVMRAFREVIEAASGSACSG